MKLAETLREAAALRAEVTESIPGDTDPEGLYEFLRLCRARVDRLEAILGQVTLYKGKMEKAVHQRAGAIEDAEVAAYQGGLRSSEYTSAKERTVEFALHSLDERREARRAEEALIDAKTAYEYVRLLYWGVDSTRKETETRLRAITLVTSLER